MPIYGQSCISAENTEPQCTSYLRGYNYITICDSSGGNGGFGGTNPGGGGSGGGGTPPTIPEETPEEIENRRDTDCESFTLIKTSGANWQEAGLNKIKLRWVWIGGGSGGYTSRNLEVNHLVLGLPTYYTNADGSTTNLSADQAANRAARVVEIARNLTYVEFRNSPYLSQDAEVKTYFVTQVAALIASYRGTGGTTGSGSANIILITR